MSMFYELMMKKRGIPSRYQEVEYIESTGTQYIDTGILTNENISIKASFSLSYIGNTYQSVCAARVSATSNSISQGFSANGSYVSFGNDSEKQAYTTLSINMIYNIEQNKDAFKIGGYSYGYQEGYTTNFTTPLSFVLFGRNNNGTKTASLIGKVYSCQILENSRLVRNFIPVYDTLTQKYGMWETVQGKFYGNDGTGDFNGQQA